MHALFVLAKVQVFNYTGKRTNPSNVTNCILYEMHIDFIIIMGLEKSQMYKHSKFMYIHLR